MSAPRLANRREFLRLTIAGTIGTAFAVACSSASPPATTAAPPAATAVPPAPTTAPPKPTVPPPTATTAPAPSPVPAAPSPTSTPAPTAAATPATKPAGKADAKGTITWLVRSDDKENKGQKDVFEPLIKQNLPNVALERVVEYNDYTARLGAMAAANQPLDLFGFGGPYYDYWVQSLPQDLTSYIQSDRWDLASYFLPGLAEIYKIGGKYWGLPQLTSFGSVTAYNRTAFDKAGIPPLPTSWDDKTWTTDKLVEYAAKLTKDYGETNGVYGIYVDLWPDAVGLPYLWGGDPYLPEHYKRFIAPKTQLNQPAIVDAFQWLQDLIYKRKVHLDPATGTAMFASGDPFADGHLAICLLPGMALWNHPSITGSKVNFAPVPLAKTRKTVTFNDFWITARWSQNKDAAWQVMRVLTSVEATKGYSLSAGTAPTVRDSLDTWLQGRAEVTGMTVAQLREVTLGALTNSSTQESPDHLFLEHGKIQEAWDGAITPLLLQQGDAKTVIPQAAATMDKVVKGIYDQYKDKIPAH